MGTRFTVDEAIENQGTADAIILRLNTAAEIARRHDVSARDFAHAFPCADYGEGVDAGFLFTWLGY